MKGSRSEQARDETAARSWHLFLFLKQQFEADEIWERKVTARLATTCLCVTFGFNLLHCLRPGRSTPEFNLHTLRSACMHGQSMHVCNNRIGFRADSCSVWMTIRVLIDQILQDMDMYACKRSLHWGRMGGRFGVAFRARTRPAALQSFRGATKATWINLLRSTTHVLTI